MAALQILWCWWIHWRISVNGTVGTYATWWPIIGAANTMWTHVFSALSACTSIFLARSTTDNARMDSPTVIRRPLLPRQWPVVGRIYRSICNIYQLDWLHHVTRPPRAHTLTTSPTSPRLSTTAASPPQRVATFLLGKAFAASVDVWRIAACSQDREPLHIGRKFHPVDAARVLQPAAPLPIP